MRQVYFRNDYERCLLSLGGHDYPIEYRWLRAHGFKGLTPWHCMDDKELAATWRRILCVKTDDRPTDVQDILPFAFAQHMDMFAGFVVTEGSLTGEVCVAELSPGLPNAEIYANIWDWFRMVCSESRAWCTPEDLEDLVGNIMD